MSYPNWFASFAQGYFEKHLYRFKDQENLHFLQIGAFTGDASLWLVQNVLTHKSSVLVDVDTWQGSDEEAHHEMDFSDVEKTYDWKLKDYPRVIKVKQTSLEYLATSDETEVYVEGGRHTSANSDTENGRTIMQFLIFSVYLQPLYEMAL